MLSESFSAIFGVEKAPNAVALSTMCAVKPMACRSQTADVSRVWCRHSVSIHRCARVT
jgi:hypothetical protein